MKRVKYILFCFLLMGACFCYAQNKDSLWKVYTNTSQSDTNRLKAMYDIAWAYIYTNPDSAIILAEQQLQLAEKTNQKKYEGTAFKTIGTAYLNKDNSQKIAIFSAGRISTGANIIFQGNISTSKPKKKLAINKASVLVLITLELFINTSLIIPKP